MGRMFKDGLTNVRNEERSGWPSVVSDYLVQSVDQKIYERRRFTLSALSCEFPQISRTLLYEIITVRLGYYKLLLKICSENAHGCAQNAENGFGFDSSRAMPQRRR
jgi:hypothetical protein